MHQTKKGNTWHFGMKAHVGVDLDSGSVHTVVATNMVDVVLAHALLRGEEKVSFADAGYHSVKNRVEITGGFADVR
jgi:IS5 family transposase